MMAHRQAVTAVTIYRSSFFICLMGAGGWQLCALEFYNHVRRSCSDFVVSGGSDRVVFLWHRRTGERLGGVNLNAQVNWLSAQSGRQVSFRMKRNDQSSGCTLLPVVALSQLWT